MKLLSQKDVVFVRELIPQDAIDKVMFEDEEASANAYFKVVEKELIASALAWAKSWDYMISNYNEDDRCVVCHCAVSVVFFLKNEQKCHCFDCLLSRAFGEVTK